MHLLILLTQQLVNLGRIYIIDKIKCFNGIHLGDEESFRQTQSLNYRLPPLRSFLYGYSCGLVGHDIGNYLDSTRSQPMILIVKVNLVLVRVDHLNPVDKCLIMHIFYIIN